MEEPLLHCPSVVSRPPARSASLSRLESFAVLGVHGTIETAGTHAADRGGGATNDGTDRKFSFADEARVIFVAAFVAPLEVRFHNRAVLLVAHSRHPGCPTLPVGQGKGFAVAEFPFATLSFVGKTCTEIKDCAKMCMLVIVHLSRDFEWILPTIFNAVDSGALSRIPRIPKSNLKH